jgi:hypothetical protein
MAVASGRCAWNGTCLSWMVSVPAALITSADVRGVDSRGRRDPLDDGP